MRKAPRTCITPGCPQLTTTTRCPTHTTQQTRLWKNPAKQAVYRTKRWRTLRNHHLTQQPWCQHPDCTNYATDVDHIVDFTDTTDPLCWDETNLQSLCKKHHSQKTARTVWARK